MNTPPTRYSALFAVLGLLLSLAPAQAQGVDFSTALDHAGLTWTAEPAARFSLASAADSHDGTDAVQFSVPAFQGSSILRTTVEGPAVVSWWWRRTDSMSTSPIMNLYFMYDGNRLADHDDENLWERVSVQIPAGPHTLEWLITYGETETVKAVLDQISVLPNQTLPESVAMNDPNGVWVRTELGAAWGVSTAITHDGMSAAEARPTQRDQGTSLRRLVSGPAQIAWWWQLQGAAAEGNQLKAKLRSIGPTDTTLLSRWDLTTPTPWQRAHFAVPAGLHVINWRYEYRSPTAINPGAGAAGQIDEFSSAPLGLQEALGLPNQVWSFGGNWGIHAASADSATPGSVSPESLGAAGSATASAWIEGNFTGPLLITWPEQLGEDAAGFRSALGFAVDGVSSPQSIVGARVLSNEWQRRAAYIPEGLHTVRWTYGNAGPVEYNQPLQFDRPQLLPLLSDAARAALDTAHQAIFQDGTAPTVSDGALRLSSQASVVIPFWATTAAAAPRLFSYKYRRGGEALNQTFFEHSKSFPRTLYPTSTWQQRRLLITEPSMLYWTMPNTSTQVDVEAVEMDAPAVDPAAWLARTGMSWTMPNPSQVLARTWDSALPSPTGDRLILLASTNALTTETTAGGVLRIVASNELGLGTSFQVTANGQQLLTSENSVGPMVTKEFAVPGGLQTLTLCTITPLVVESITYTPGTGDTTFIGERLGGAGMSFHVSAGATATFVNDPFWPNDRNYLRLAASSPPPELIGRVQGPGVLTFDCRLELLAGNVNNNLAQVTFRVGDQPQQIVGGSGWWAKVRVAIPPSTGPISLRWGSAGTYPLHLDNLVWEPSQAVAPAAVPATDLLRDGLVPGRPHWRVQPSGVGEPPNLMLPWDGTVGGSVPQSLTVTGPGVLVADARLMASSLLPHFSFQGGTCLLSLSTAGSEALSIAESEAWRPIVLPLAAGPQTVTIQLLSHDGYDPRDAKIPATLELRSARVLPQATAASLAVPGLSWDVSLAANAVAVPHGTSTRWYLPSGSVLTANVQGPGTFEATATSSYGKLSVSLNGGVPQEWELISYEAVHSATHQWVLPSGNHRITWGSAVKPGFFLPPPPTQALDMKWTPSGSATPPLALALGLPATAMAYLQSDGGWIPDDSGDSRLRLRTRFAGPASIALNAALSSFASPFWGTGNQWGDDLPNESISSPSWHGSLPGYEWQGPSGERGALLEPYPVIRVGKIGSSAAAPQETVAEWAARHGLAGNAAAATADTDGDGLEVLMESVLGLDPRVPDPGFLRLVPPGNAQTAMQAQFPWPANIPAGTTRVIEASSDLQNWQPQVPTVTNGVATVPMTAPLKFVRMRVFGG